MSNLEIFKSGMTKEDIAHATGDLGTPIFAVRKDTAASLADTDGDYSVLITDANGRLHVLDQNSAAMLTALQLIDDAVAAESEALGKGILIQGDDGTDRTNILVDTAGHLQVDVLSGGGGGTQYAEDAGHTTGATGTLALVVRQDTAAQLADTDADYSVLITDANGRLHVLDANSAAIKTAVELIDNAISGTEMQVDVVAELPAGTQNIGDVDVATIAAGTNVIGKIRLVTTLGDEITDDTADAVKAILQANSGVDIGDVDVLSLPSDTFAADAQAYGKGVLCQGDDGTDRRAILVGTDGHVQVDIVGALPAGSAAIGKLAANSGVDIGDVDILSIAAGTNQIGARSKCTLLTSAILSADTNVKAAAGEVYWMSVSDSAALSIEINDSTDGAGTDKWGQSLPADCYAHYIFDPPIECGTGIYIDVSTATCKVSVGYK